jgi:hypothetical protein
LIEPIQDFLERLDQEQQANRQAVKKLEKFKRDMDKLQVILSQNQVDLQRCYSFSCC